MSLCFDSNLNRKKIVNGQTITLIDLDPLTQRLRNYFGCPTLQGAYLENEGATGSAGSHLERRIFMNEVKQPPFYFTL